MSAARSTRWQLVIALWLLSAAGALAQEGSGGGDQPIEITADRLVLEQNQQKAIFTGNVDAVQGDTTLRTDLLRVFYTSDEERKASGTQQTVRRLEAEGNVVITQPGETATGNSGEYDVVGGKMVLLGDVVLTRNKNVVRGDRLDVDRNTGVSVVSVNKAAAGDRRDRRVRALFVPEPASPAP